MFRAVVRDGTLLISLLGAEQWKRQSVMRTIQLCRRVPGITVLWFIQAGKIFILPCVFGYDSCLRAISSQVSGCVHNCGTVYHSNVNAQLNMYEQSLQQSGTLFWGVSITAWGELCHDVSPADHE